jgi:hypothetical protein
LVLLLPQAHRHHHQTSHRHRHPYQLPAASAEMALLSLQALQEALLLVVAALAAVLCPPLLFVHLQRPRCHLAPASAAHAAVAVAVRQAVLSHPAVVVLWQWPAALLQQPAVAIALPAAAATEVAV